MKNSIYILIVLTIMMVIPSRVQGQTFFGFQAPKGTHTFFFSLSWQGKPHLGLGYNLRVPGRTWTDLSAELRFPVDEIYKFDNHQLITGLYKPLRLRNRTFSSIGVHARIDKETFDANQQTHYGLAVSYLPTFAYAASLTDGAYNTMAMRFTYNPILLTKSGEAGAANWEALTGHRVQVGGHLDMHLERTFVFSSDGYATQIFGAKKDFQGNEDESIQFEGNLFIGTAYGLQRWIR